MLFDMCLIYLQFLFLVWTDNKEIPTALQKEALKLQKSLAYDDEGGEGEATTWAIINRS